MRRSAAATLPPKEGCPSIHDHQDRAACRLVSPVVESFGEAHAEKMAIAKVNTDENQALAMRYSIFSIPTLIVFQNGREAARLVGYMPQEVMEERLSQFLA